MNSKLTAENIQTMNNSYPWISQPIQFASIPQSKIKNDKNTEFILVATGDADLNGRIYVALPSNMTTNTYIKKKYNLI